MAYRFDKKSILKRMHYKKPRKKTVLQRIVEVPRLGLNATSAVFKATGRVVKFAFTKRGFALAGAMMIVVAAGIAFYQPPPSGDEGLAVEEIIVIPIDGEGQYIKLDGNQKLESSEVIDHLANHHKSDSENPGFHSRSAHGPNSSGPSLQLSQSNRTSSKKNADLSVANQVPGLVPKPVVNGVELLGIIETDDPILQPARISSRPSSGSSVN